MANFGVKTPVSCLQEYLVSKKMVPHYELIHNGVGSHNPEFIFSVRVGALSEEGSGRSKQEAKHRAAEKMLKSLKVIEDKIEEEEETNDFIKEFNENYVGQLKDLCIFHRYPTPKYYLEEASGPSHNRIFKMICCVSQLQDSGISRTKKQAKHQAAFKMLQLLKEVISKKNEENIPHQGSINKTTCPMTDEEIVKKYSALKSKHLDTVDHAAYYKDHHKAYIELLETSPALKKLINESDKIDFENSLSLIQEITEELKVTLIKTEIPSKKKNNCIILTMTVFPSIAAVGIDEENAAFHLLNTLLILCKE